MADYIPSFYFNVSFNGFDVAFREVSGISRQMNIEEVACGGENRFKYRLPTVASSPNLVLKGAIVQKGSVLLSLCSAYMDQGYVNVLPVVVTVSLLGPDGLACLLATFYNAYPVNYSLSELKSDENALVMESVEFAYTYSQILNV